MYKPLVSVMIPFYNNQATIQRCLDSVVALSYRPLEVLLVDDAGTDDCLNIVQRYIANNTDRLLTLKLLRQPRNMGLACARIRGISEASGEYIAFVDADDYIQPQAITEYVKASAEGRYDMVAAGVIYQYPNRSDVKLYKPGESLNLREATINAMHFLLTNKLIRTSCLKVAGTHTPGQDYWEDLGAVCRLLASGASTKVLDGAWYHYVQYNATAMTKSDPDRVLHQHIEVARSLEQWMEERGVAAENRQFLTYLKFIAKVKYLRNPRQLIRHPIRRLRAWRDTFPEVNPHIFSLKHVQLRYRLIFAIARILSSPL